MKEIGNSNSYNSSKWGVIKHLGENPHRIFYRLASKVNIAQH